MSAPAPHPTSVAPPGWVPPGGAAAPSVGHVPVPAAAPLAGNEPSRALRARINAGILDLLLLSGIWTVMVLAQGWERDSASALVLMFVLPVVYHAAFELLRDGQSPGKRRVGIRVVRTDGKPLDLKTVLLRSVLRFIDEAPVWYASGLISVWRTGPTRRQRLGDVVAGTLVVPGGGTLRPARHGERAMRISTVLAVVASCGAIAAIALDPGGAAQREQFLAGCQQGGGSAQACGCLYDTLHDVHGYRTTDDLVDLERRVVAAGADGAKLPAEYVAAVETCARTGALRPQ